MMRQAFGLFFLLIAGCLSATSTPPAVQACADSSVHRDLFMTLSAGTMNRSFNGGYSSSWTYLDVRNPQPQIPTKVSLLARWEKDGSAPRGQIILESLEGDTLGYYEGPSPATFAVHMPNGPATYRIRAGLAADSSQTADVAILVYNRHVEVAIDFTFLCPDSR